MSTKTAVVPFLHRGYMNRLDKIILPRTNEDKTVLRGGNGGRGGDGSGGGNGGGSRGSRSGDDGGGGMI